MRLFLTSLAIVTLTASAALAQPAPVSTEHVLISRYRTALEPLITDRSQLTAINGANTQGTRPLDLAIFAVGKGISMLVNELNAVGLRDSARQLQGAPAVRDAASADATKALLRNIQETVEANFDETGQQAFHELAGAIRAGRDLCDDLRAIATGSTAPGNLSDIGNELAEIARTACAMPNADRNLCKDDALRILRELVSNALANAPPPAPVAPPTKTRPRPRR